MWNWSKQRHPAASAPNAAADKPETVTAPPRGTIGIADPTWGAQARFISLSDEAAGWLAGLGSEFNPEAVIDRFFAKVSAVPELRGIMSRHSTEERLKTAWTAHWRELTGGRVDDEYVRRRLKIGQTHVRVGLSQHWYLGAYTWVFDELVQAIRRRYGADPDMLVKAIDAAFRMVTFDMQTGVEAYIQGILAQRDDREAALVQLQVEAQAQAAEAHAMRERMVDSAAPLAAVAEELAAQVEEMRTGAERAASAAEACADNARKAVEHSATGQARANVAAEVVAGTAAAVSGAGGAMAQVEQSVQQIERFVDVIDGLAGQTNLLALNAAIEAARAGAHGRGFGVVAGEMRRLADRTQGALSEIRRLVQEARGAVATASAQTQIVTEASDHARAAVADAVSEFRGITAVTDQSLQGFQAVTRDLQDLVGALVEITRASDVVAGQAAALVEGSGARG